MELSTTDKPVCCLHPTLYPLKTKTFFPKPVPKDKPEAARGSKIIVATGQNASLLVHEISHWSSSAQPQGDHSQECFMPQPPPIFWLGTSVKCNFECGIWEAKKYEAKKAFSQASKWSKPSWLLTHLRIEKFWTMPWRKKVQARMAKSSHEFSLVPLGFQGKASLTLGAGLKEDINVNRNLYHKSCPFFTINLC